MGTIITTPNQRQFELKYDLFDHQKATFLFMRKNPHSYILNQMGTGKTECAVSIATYLKLNNNIKKTLIISTLSTIRNVWLNAIEHNNLQYFLKPIVIDEKTRKKNEQLILDDNYDTVIINCDKIDKYEEVLLKCKFDCIIIDEATTFKNHTSERFKSLLKIIKKYPPSHFYLMTGTPTPNSPTDCFGLLKLFKPKEYTSFNRFRDLVEREIRAFTWIPLPDAYDTVHKHLQPAICFKTQKVINIANTEYYFEEFKMNQQQEKLFKQMKKEFMVLMENGETISSANAAIKLNKLLQIIGGSLINEDQETITFDVSNKLEKLKEILTNKVNNKAIIFCSHKAQIKIISDFLKTDFAIITGDVNQKDRDLIFKTFQNTDKIKYLIAMPQCMAHGITLTDRKSVV